MTKLTAPAQLDLPLPIPEGEEPALKSFVVHGHRAHQPNNVGQDWYYRAVSAAHLDKVLLALSPAEGGFVSFSALEVEELPSEAFSTCPHCEQTHLNLTLVTTV